jgi:WD40 repeat protein
VKVWDAATGQLALTLQGHAGPVTSVDFSPDGKRLASASGDQTVKVWDAATGQLALTLQGHTLSVASVAFSPDGKRLASASHDLTVKVWDASRPPAPVGSASR